MLNLKYSQIFVARNIFAEQADGTCLAICHKARQEEFYLKDLTDTEIPYLHGASTCNQKIIWFNVPMHYILQSDREKAQRSATWISVSKDVKDSGFIIYNMNI